MTDAIINRVITNTGSPTIPESRYTCQKCGYRNLNLGDNYCPNCGEIIHEFYTINKER